MQTGVLKGGKSLIADETVTLPDFLKERGYYTTMIGKWHLGMKFNGIENNKKGAVKPGEVVTEGLIDSAGFDEFHGFHYARQMDLWIDNDKVTKNLDAIDMLPELTKSAVNFIESRKGNKQPFFMYIPWNAPHSPVVPSKDWQGKSGINAHADFVMQTDDSYGQVIKALKENGLWENTIVFYSSDNGTSPATSGQKKLKEFNHKSSAQFRGFKSDIYDGGNRVPFMVTWPKHIKKGSRSSDLVCLTDIYSTVAEITKFKLTDKDGVDSVSFLDVIKGKDGTPRTDVIHHSISGYFAIRKGDWKLCVGNGSGGWGQPKQDFEKSLNPKELSDSYQLFDMSVAEPERINLANEHPEIVGEMVRLLEKQVKEGRSTVGEVQSNDDDTKIVVHKGLVKKK